MNNLGLGVIDEILDADINTPFLFSVNRLEKIRKGADYSGVRIFLQVVFEKINEVVTIDVTVGDCIVPKEIEFELRALFSEEKIQIVSYPIETIISEKIQTILSRGILATRARDYYDVYFVYNK